MERKFLTITNASKNETVIDIDGNIGPYIDWVEWRMVMDNTYQVLKSKLKDVPQSSTHVLRVNIASLGGSMDDGFKMHDLLSEHKATVITDVKGFSASAATLIAQAGSKGKRRMSANSFYLIHEASGDAYGNSKEVAAQLELLTTANNIAADLYARRSGKDAEFFLELMGRNNGNGVWLTAEEAKEYGLIDEVYEPNEKAVTNVSALAGLMNSARNLPPLPQVTNNSPDMTIQEMFEGLKNLIQNQGKPAPSNEGEAPTVVEVKILDNEEVQNKLSEMETAISNAVSKEDHDKIVNEKTALETAKTELENSKTALENKVAELQAKVDKAGGKPTELDNEGDPIPTGGTTKSAMEMAYDKEAEKFKS